jgi:hypothetical protein
MLLLSTICHIWMLASMQNKVPLTFHLYVLTDILTIKAKYICVNGIKYQQWNCELNGHRLYETITKIVIHLKLVMKLHQACYLCCHMRWVSGTLAEMKNCLSTN